MLDVCVAGATGWAGGELARAIADVADIRIVAAVARASAGKRLGDVLGVPLDAPIYATADEALDAHPCDVLVEYTGAESAMRNIRSALSRDRHVVVGSSGVGDAEFAELDGIAKQRGRAVLACGNFALTVVLLQKFATMAAKYLPSWEIIDYAHAGKPDAPSGTTRELAARLGAVRAPAIEVPVDRTRGIRETRGGEIANTRIHSLRLPGFVIGAEVIFGMPDQRLSLRHDAGGSARPYIDGALLAIKNVGTLAPGVHRGLDAVLDL